MNGLIVYYSRTGTTETVARALGQMVGFDVEKIEDNRDRSGPIGYLKSGWEAFREKRPEIEDMDEDVEEYDIIVIGTPVWAQGPSSPVRTFLYHHREVLKDKKLVFLCTLGGSGAEKTFKEMKNICKKDPMTVLPLKKKEVDSDDHEEKLKGLAQKLS